MKDESSREESSRGVKDLHGYFRMSSCRLHGQKLEIENRLRRAARNADVLLTLALVVAFQH